MNKILITKIRDRFAYSRPKKSLTTKEQIYFVDRLYFLLNSGVPLLESLQIIENQVGNEKKKAIYRQIVENVSKGKFLSTCCEGFLNEFARNVIYTGERSGFLASNLEHLSLQLKKNRDLKKKVQQAFIYPTFIAFTALAMTVFLIFYIFPKILPVIESLNVKLPLATRFVIGFSNFISNFWIAMILFLLISSTVLVVAFKKALKFRFWIHQISLTSPIPIWSSTYRSFLLSNFCRTISFLLKGGLSFDQSLEITKNSTTNLFLRSKIEEMNNLVLRGGLLSDYLFQSRKIFSEDFASMVSIGERTGNLQMMFENLGNYYEQQFSEKVKNLSQMIEPALMITVGLVVGFIAVSIISPIYGVTNGLQKF